jgi:hypothetical protein
MNCILKYYVGYIHADVKTLVIFFSLLHNHETVRFPSLCLFHFLTFYLLAGLSLPEQRASTGC